MRRFVLFAVLVFVESFAGVAAQDLDFKPIPVNVPGKKYCVRIAYAVPTNRQPRPAVIRNLQTLLPWLQVWYQTQMDRHGFGRKTFEFETEPGVRPPIHLVRLPGPDTDYHHSGIDGGDAEQHSAAWLQLCQSAQQAGVPLNAEGQIWLVAYETHLQQADGSIVGRLNRGGPWLRNQHNGVGTAITTLLGLADETGMSLNQPYDGMTVAAVGRYPMRYGKTFSTYAGGKTFGGVISGEVASMMHELSHAFGLKHNNLNDAHTAGNLMGVGYRGIRSEIYSRRFPGEAVNLSPASAALLNVVRQFNSNSTFNDDEPPVIKSATLSTLSGQLVARVHAKDNGQLKHAFLLIDGNVVASEPISGEDNSVSLRTYQYRTGKSFKWSVRVYDSQGNHGVTSGTTALRRSQVHAPIPVLQADRYHVKLRQEVMLDASNSTDPDSEQLKFAWDTNGDGQVDTRLSSQRSFPIRLQTTGHHKFRVKVSDGHHTSMSPPIVITVK